MRRGGSVPENSPPVIPGRREAPGPESITPVGEYEFRPRGLAPQNDAQRTLAVAGVGLVADLSGALYWPEERLLVVADLHLEKGSAFARRGVLLPPYDTAATLARLAGAVDRYAPRRVIALGDSFHDGGGPERLGDDDRAGLRALQRGRDWVWIAGNHDPDPAQDIGGTFARVLACGPLTFRHQPVTRKVRARSDAKPVSTFADRAQVACDGEIAGHLHPSARVSRRGRTVARRCFASDGTRLVMPAFGAYAGGLNIRDRAFLAVFGALAFTAHLLGDRRLYAFSAARCLG